MPTIIKDGRSVDLARFLRLRRRSAVFCRLSYARHEK